MKKLIYCFLGLSLLMFIAVAAAGYWGYRQIENLAQQPITAQADQLLTIERGTTGKKLGEFLQQQGLLKDATFFPFLLRFQPELSAVKAGTYSLNGVTNVTELLQLLNSGKEAQFGIRFGDGETFKQIRQTLAAAPHLQLQLGEKSEAEVFDLLGLAPVEGQTLKNLEGLIYPDTYHYTVNATDVGLLQRAIQRTQQALDKAWQQRDKDLPLKNPYEMLILASIVEKETAIASERPQVAAVFINRLKRGMRLQTDPTVIYGMGDNYQGNIRRKDLDEKTAYNTYQIDGLPPTPIAMPNEASLQAVAHPADTTALYFVADGSGGHKFSNSLAEHNQAVQQYLKWLRSQKNGN
ncbi:endolytic transglycosylase MltG [Testudinibacter aquarius]|uniref:Endolytic murein transglycosylase n=2 Tax=Testudinibacter aquarius TaxID=1524974 RepID=A0ABY2XU21_9PAST|nr:endolytic transglycosylase MltG [Testudinibacter aquarius]KAE9525537.1 aminodeoxychorismate lyase [Testudinibacter aquarius]TNG89606.1 endolytic transglycosylase MltG [Testudinibacter aquarius]